MRRPRPGLPWSRARLAHRCAYAAYLDSQAWATARRRWYAEWVARTGAEPTCQVCGGAWTLTRGQLHHRNYTRLGNERFTDLVPLCPPDHEALHRLFDASPAWRRLGRPLATDGIITGLRRTRRATA